MQARLLIATLSTLLAAMTLPSIVMRSTVQVLQVPERRHADTETVERPPTAQRVRFVDDRRSAPDVRDPAVRVISKPMLRQGTPAWSSALRAKSRNRSTTLVRPKAARRPGARPS